MKLKHFKKTPPPTSYNELLDWHIKPHAETLVKLFLARKIAVVVAPGVTRRTTTLLGGSRRSPAFGLSDAYRASLIRSCRERGDVTTVRWLTNAAFGRIFYVSSAGGTMLINFEPTRGYSLEPGSLDHQWMS